MSSASPMHKFCVGTLVSSKYVVTAAQCVHQRLASQVFSMLGEFYLGATGETPTLEHVLTIDRIILHEFFDPATLAYDLALLELTAPVDLSVFTPACLARATDTLAGELGAQVFGWDRESLELFEAPAVAVTRAACSAAMGGALLTSGMLCARSVEGHRSQWPCQVLVFIQNVSYLSLSCHFQLEGGGPLTNKPYGRQHVLIGGFSWRNNSEHCGLVRYIGRKRRPLTLFSSGGE